MSYKWTMTVLAATALRRRLALLREEEAKLKQQREAAASRAEKMALTKRGKDVAFQIASILETLTGAPPLPMTEADAVAELLSTLRQIEDSYQSCRTKFMESANVNPAEAIRWDAEKLLVAQYKAAIIAEELTDMGREVEGRSWRLADMVAVIAEVERQAQQQVHYFAPLSLSTSAFHNVVAACRYQAARELLENGYNNIAYLRRRAEQLEQHVAAYNQLQAEMQAEALAGGGENGGSTE